MDDNNVKKYDAYYLSGEECFRYNDEETELKILDMWRWYFSDLFDIKAVVAEYMVSKALGFTKPYNTGYWTAHRIEYRERIIDLRAATYIRSMRYKRAEGNMVRHIDIRAKDGDIYVFCINTGKTDIEADPLNLNNWRFYIIPVWYLENECEKNRSISLTKVQRLVKDVDIMEFKEYIDNLIDNMNSGNE